MAFFNEFPNTRTYDKDLGWLIHVVGQLQNDVKTFIENNTINIPDQITWDITKQYTQNTLVIDYDGTAYLSKQPVPIGIAITNTEYWMPIFNYDDSINTLRANIATNERNNTTATAERHAGDLVWLGNALYKVTADMPAGTAYIAGTNVELYTIEDYLLFLKGAIAAEAQARESADTTLQGNIDTVQGNVDAEVLARQGADTTLQGNIDAEVLARQESDATLQGNIDTLSTSIGNIHFVNVKNYGAVGDGVHDDTQAFLDAFAAADGETPIIIPFGTYYLTQNPITQTIRDGGTNSSILMDAGAMLTGPFADPNYPTSNGAIASPMCNLGNRLLGNSLKMYSKTPSPSGNGCVADSVEMLADTSDDYITITGSISHNSHIMSVSSTAGITVGSGVLLVSPANASWPDGTTKQNTVRVTAVHDNNNTIEVGFPDVNPIAWSGAANSSNWTGTAITNGTFKIRHRYWNVTQFIGSVAGKGNVDRIGYGMNIVTSSDGNLSYGVELDMDFGAEQQPNADVIHKGVYILGFGTSTPLTRALQIEHSASNWMVGAKIQNAYHGVEVESLGAITISPTFFNRATNATEPIVYGILCGVPESRANPERPTLASTQIANGSSVIYLERSNDATPVGHFIKCMSADGATQLFGVDVLGQMGVNKVFASDVTATNFIVATLPEAKTITCDKVIKIKCAADGNTYEIPCTLSTP